MKSTLIVEGQFDLFAIENLHDEHFVTVVLKPAEAFIEMIQVAKQIGDDDDHPAAVDLVGDFGHDVAEFGRALGAVRSEHVENLVSCDCVATGRSQARSASSKIAMPDRVALPDAKMRPMTPRPSLRS